MSVFGIMVKLPRAQNWIRLSFVLVAGKSVGNWIIYDVNCKFLQILVRFWQIQNIKYLLSFYEIVLVSLYS